MTRVAAYLGPPLAVGALLDGGTSSLAHQSAASPDGFGVGWYPGDGDSRPARLIHDGPVAGAPHHIALTHRVYSGCAVASVRRALPGEANELAACQPQSHGRFLFCHTGHISQFRESFDRPLREPLSEGVHRLLRGSSASELLFATWLDLLGDRTDSDAMADALDKMVARVDRIATAKGAAATFGVVVTDGRCLVSLRTATNGEPPDLFSVLAPADAPVPESGRLIASEPLFAGDWSEVEPHSLTIFTIGT